MQRSSAALGDLLHGRKTYDIFAAHWPYVPEGDPVGPTFTKAAKFVLTRGHEALEWQNSHRLPDLNAVKTVKAMSRPAPCRSARSRSQIRVRPN